MSYITSLLVFCLLFVSTLSGCAATPLTIVEQGKSTFNIVIPTQSPASIKAAARELQRDIQLATGAKLTVEQDNTAVKSPFISLGATRQAQAAKVLSRKIALEGFTILTRDGNIYIWGPDTADSAFTENGGTSNGTANGVYTFLEDYLDVRWLMPGDLGRDVPHKSTFSVDDIDHTEAPGFINRREPYIQNKLPAVSNWEDHQKLGFSFSINHAHSWTKTVTPDLYKTHPDWFAMINGKRPAPAGQYKLETTNQEMVHYFAERAIERLKANPQANTFSLSPSDGRGWSQSPESKALYDPVPLEGNFPGTSPQSPSVTPLVLQFYRDVANIVAQEYPQGNLAGYIYNEYLFPPVKGDMTLPDNFYPVVASSLSYGYTLYRKDVQGYYHNMMQSWAKITPHLFYYDLPNKVSENSGVVTPAAPKILNIVFPTLMKNNVKGVYIYGTQSWSNAAMANYILAKMMWNPQLDASNLQREWLRRAYGPQAGAAMEKLYARLDTLFRDYYQTHPSVRYRMSDDMLKEIYVPHYAELETLFLQAKTQPMTTPQQQRLQLIEDNLVVLQWRLRKMNALPAGFTSALQRDDNFVTQLLFRPNADFALFPGLVDEGPKPPAVNAQISKALPSQSAASALPLRGENQALIYAAQDGDVRITPGKIKHGDAAVSYVLKDQKGHILSVGMMTPGKTTTFAAKARTSYFLYIPDGIYKLSIEGASAAYLTTSGKRLSLHPFGQPAMMYFYVPEGTDKWSFMVRTGSGGNNGGGETAKVTITAPDGKQAAVLETTTQPTQRVNLEGKAGFWKIEVGKAATGILDDVYLTFDAKLPQWISVNPAQPLVITPESN